MIALLADVSQYTPPAASNDLAATIMYWAVFIAAVSTVIKQWAPKPALVEQLEALKTWVAQYFTSRTRFDALDTKVTDIRKEKLRRFGEVDVAIRELRDEMLEGHDAIKKAGEARWEKLSGDINQIGINNANGIGELRGELKRIK